MKYNLIGLLGEKQSGKNLTAKIIQLLLDHNLKPIEVEAILKQPEIKNIKDIANLDIHTTWKVKAFSDKLKQILSIITGIPVEDMEKEEVKNTVLPKQWDRYGVQRKDCKRLLFFPCTLEYAEQQQKLFKDSEVVKKSLTVREALQYIGTDLFRDEFHENTWINALFSNYKVPNYKEGKTYSSLDLPKWLITDCRFSNEVQAIHDNSGIVIKIENENKVETDLHSSETSVNLCKFDYKLIYKGQKNLKEYIKDVSELLKKLN